MTHFHIRVSLSIFIFLGVFGCSDDATNGSNPNNVANNGGNANNGGGGVVEEPTCTDGSCTCSSGLVLCGDVCVDLSLNTNHCGECRESCGTGASECVSGACVCGAQAVSCGDECVDLSTDVENCGGCGDDCNDGETCVSGTCQALQCDTGLVACNGECADLSADPNHCGECGTQCFDGETCTSGQCGCDDLAGVCGAIGNEGRSVGGACDQNNACAANSICLTDGEFPDGTCSIACAADKDCPDQTACMKGNDGTGVCLLLCDSDGSCRPGYSCDDHDQVQRGEREVCIKD